MPHFLENAGTWTLMAMVFVNKKTSLKQLLSMPFRNLINKNRSSGEILEILIFTKLYPDLLNTIKIAATTIKH